MCGDVTRWNSVGLEEGNFGISQNSGKKDKVICLGYLD